MTTINVSKDNHEQLIESGYGLFTKAGKEWMCRGGKQRIDWSMIEVYGNVIECHFGKFIFIKHESKEKEHYWILRNVDTNKYYEIKRNQVRNNKHLNVKWEIEYKGEVSEKEVEVMSVPKITELFPMPLLLTAPKENTLPFLTWDDFHGIFLDAIKSKDIKEVKRIYRKYAKMYHPDMNKNTNTDVFDNLNSVYEFAKMEVKRPVFNKKDFIKNLKKQKK